MLMKFELLEPYIPMFMSGLVVTCQVTAAALVIALALGFLIAVLKVSRALTGGSTTPLGPSGFAMFP